MLFDFSDEPAERETNQAFDTRLAKETRMTKRRLEGKVALVARPRAAPGQGIATKRGGERGVTG